MRNSRRSYYDAEPWYQREGGRAWYQQMPLTNDCFLELARNALAKKGSVLEIACGGGNVALALKENFHSYLGLDYAPSAIEMAKSRDLEGSGFEFKQGDALEPGWYEDSYDLIMAHQFLHCLIGKDRTFFLNLCFQSLQKSRGKLLISSMFGFPKGLEIDQDTRVNPPGNRYYARKHEILEELKTAGFHTENMEEPEDHSMVVLCSLS